MLSTIDDTTSHNRQYLNEHASELQEVTENLYAFYSVFVSSRFEDDCEAPHIKKLAKKLMNITDGTSKKNRLLCAMPPQHSKSSLVTLAYSVWLIINDPSKRILIVNAEKELSIEFGIAIRQLIQETYKLLSEESMSKFQRFKRATRTFGDLSKREIKEIIRNGKSSGFDWFSER